MPRPLSAPDKSAGTVRPVASRIGPDLRLEAATRDLIARLKSETLRHGLASQTRGQANLRGGAR